MNQLDSTRVVQRKALEGLLEIDRICKKHDLKYYLVGGSALGAVRHKGFIPWDDDIDVALPRGDYERFLKICKKELLDKFFLQTRDTDPEYIFQFAKLRINNTKYVQKSVEGFDIHQGIFIDVFPIDKISTNKLIALKQKIMVQSFIKFRSAKIHNYNSAPLKYIVKKILGSLFSYEVIHSVITKNILLANNTNSSYIGNLLGVYGFRKEVFHKEIFGEPYLAEFEGYQFPIPEQYNIFLTQIYGDYMKLPPLNQRTNHNPVLVEINGKKVLGKG